MESSLSRERIVGKQVIDSNGHILGSVKDIALDLKSKAFSIRVTTRGGTEVGVQVEDIAASGDVILLNKPIIVPESPGSAQAPPPLIQPAPVQQPQPPTAPTPVVSAPAQTLGLCPSCGYQNDTSSRFCIKCGTKLKP